MKSKYFLLYMNEPNERVYDASSHYPMYIVPGKKYHYKLAKKRITKLNTTRRPCLLGKLLKITSI